MDPTRTLLKVEGHARTHTEMLQRIAVVADEFFGPGNYKLVTPLNADSTLAFTSGGDIVHISVSFSATVAGPTQ